MPFVKVDFLCLERRLSSYTREGHDFMLKWFYILFPSTWKLHAQHFQYQIKHECVRSHTCGCGEHNDFRSHILCGYYSCNMKHPKLIHPCCLPWLCYSELNLEWVLNSITELNLKVANRQTMNWRGGGIHFYFCSLCCVYFNCYSVQFTILCVCNWFKFPVTDSKFCPTLLFDHETVLIAYYLKYLLCHEDKQCVLSEFG